MDRLFGTNRKDTLLVNTPEIRVVEGYGGNHTITLKGNFDYPMVDAGAGDDVINITYSRADFGGASIITGAGNDTVNLDITDLAFLGFSQAYGDQLQGFSEIDVNLDFDTGLGTITKGTAGVTTITGLDTFKNADGIRFDGTDGDDSFSVSGDTRGEYVSISTGFGNDTVTIADGTDMVLGYSRLGLTDDEKNIVLVADLEAGTVTATYDLEYFDYDLDYTVYEYDLSFTDTISGTVSWFRGSAGADFIYGSAADEVFDMGAGGGFLDGGDGFDTLRMTSRAS